MKRILVNLFSLVALSVFLLSCGKDKVEPKNIIDDAQGVKLYLTWTVNGSQSLAGNADLDLFLMKGATVATAVEAESSEGTSTSETIYMDDYNTDGTYFAQIEYYSGSGRVDYKIEAVGRSTNKVLNFTSHFLSTDVTARPTIVKIVKTGNSYRVEQYSAN